MPSLRPDQVGWLLAGAALTLAPHAGHLPPAIGALCALLLVWRGLISHRGSRLPPRTLLAVLAAGIVGAVLRAQRQPGLSPVVALQLQGAVPVLCAELAPGGPQPDILNYA